MLKKQVFTFGTKKSNYC